MFKKLPLWWQNIKVLIFGVDPDVATLLQQGEDAAFHRIRQAVTFVEAVKQLVHNRTFDFISQLTPMQWDDRFLAHARAGTVRTLRRLKLAEQVIESLKHPIPAIDAQFLAAEVAETLRDQDDKTRHAAYAEIAARIALTASKPNQKAVNGMVIEVSTYYEKDFKPALAALNEQSTEGLTLNDLKA